MALLDDISSAFSGFGAVGSYLISAVVFVILAFIIFSLRRRSIKKRLRRGTNRERREEKQAGPAFSDDERAEEKEEIRGEHLQHETKELDEGQEDVVHRTKDTHPKGDGPKALMSAEGAAAVVMTVEEDVEHADEVSGSQLPRAALATVASIETESRAIGNASEWLMRVEDREVHVDQVVDAVIHRIQHDVNAGVISRKTAEQLKMLFEQMKQELEEMLQSEEGKIHLYKQMIAHVKPALDSIRDSIQDARFGLNELNHIQHAEDVDASHALSELTRAIHLKKRQLEKLKSASRKTNPGVSERLKDLIQILEEQRRTVKQLKKHFDRTRSYFKHAKKRLSRLLKDVVTQEKHLEHFEHELESYMHILEEKEGKLQELRTSLEIALKIDEQEAGNDLVAEQDAVAMSQVLQTFYTQMLEIMQKDLDITDVFREIAVTGVTVTNQMEAESKITQGLTKLSGAVQRGVAQMAVLIKTVTADATDEEAHQTQENLDSLLEQIKEEIDIEHHQTELENDMMRISKKVEIDATRAAHAIQDVEDLQRRLLASVRKSFSDNRVIIGNTLSAMIQHRRSVDKKYMSRVRDYAGDMRTIHSSVGRAFDQAQRFRQRAQRTSNKVAA